MTRLVPVAVAIALSFTACGAMLAQPADGRQYTNSEIKQMIREAHTVQQYQEIATYFEGRQQYFRQQAYSEFVELERRSQNVTCLAAKYPRPVDSSRNRYEYFKYEARQMALQAQHFESLSANSQ